ncbi:T9SS type A sorting domain-containing protein [Adhaeribacter radiodurans]|uniref:T9SS type A sorting domain-containing protein n=1 Tax=Adhaeribacter radiodurans TaxID=2745197 RepID=A0A7L7LF96_9BACT|nr:T9SS type A sorting domain-containing protein [Adhaeribacter radiodurans]QMU31039.1 T9SS type A sorting domain-containing protein [Adhaeribacter radiodurans]
MKIVIFGFCLIKKYWVGTPGWRILGATLLLNLLFMAEASAQNKLWDKTIGGNSDDYLSSVQPTRDGGFILGGFSYSSKKFDKSENNKGGYDYWIVKLKSDGSKEWDRTIGSSDWDYFRFVQQTSDGGYILGGHTYGGKSRDKSGFSKGGQDYWIVKLNAKGDKVWDKTLGGNDNEELQSLQQTKDGGYIILGNSNSSLSGDKSQASKGGQDYWIVKLKADGSKAWDKTIGSNSYDQATSIQQTKNGGYIVTGVSSANISGDKSQDSKGGDDFWVVSLNADGSKAWDRTIGGNNGDAPTAVRQTSDGGYIVGGYSSSGISDDKTQASKGNNDYWVVKLNADGSKEWDKTIGSNGWDNLTGLQQNSDGSYILGGNSSSGIGGNKTQISKGGNDYWVVKLNTDGSIAWDKTIGGNSDDNLSSILQLSDGNFLLGGFSYTSNNGDKSEKNKGGYDYWVVKLDNSGTNLNQIITFAPILYKNVDDPPLTLEATTSSGLPITYTVESGPATISDGNKLTLTGLGTVTVKAAQLGTTIFLPASVTRSFLVEPPSMVKKQWDQTIGGNSSDQLVSVQQTSDKGYILGGSSSSGKNGDKSATGKGGQDYWIVKLRADGSKEWDKTIGGNREDYLSSVQQTKDGGYILGGYSFSGMSGDKSQPTKGSWDYWVVKLRANGTKEWDQTLGGRNEDYLTSVQPTQDGGYILGGYSTSGIGANKTEANRGISDYWVVKLKADGSKSWDKTIGGRYEDVLTSIQQTKDSGYILGGYSLSGISGEKSQARIGSTDYWIVKLEANGEKTWDKTIGGTDEDYLSSLQQTSDEGYILGGYSWSGISGNKSQASIGQHDYWIVKLKTDGTKDWDKTLGGNESDVLTSVRQTSDGGYIVGGNSFSAISGDKTQVPRGAPDYDYWIIKLKADGSKVWDKTLGGNDNDVLASVLPTGNGEYILGGTSNSAVFGDKSESSKGNTDFWIVKLKEEVTLNTVWDMRFGGNGQDNLTSVIKTRDGGYLSGGYTNSGNNGDKSQNSQGMNDYWIVKSNKNGEKEWDKRYGGSGEDYLNRVIQTLDGGYLLAGNSLSGKSGDKSQASQGDRDYWVIKVDGQGNQEWDKTFGGSGSDDLIKAIQLASGEYVLGGYSSSPQSGDKSQDNQGGKDYWLVKMSNTGEKLWDKRYGGSKDDKLGSFTDTRDGGFFLGGSSYSNISGDKTQENQGSSDFWAVKTDKDGNLLWEKTFGGSGQDEVNSVRRSHGDNLYLAGTSDSDKSGDKSQSSLGGKDYWLVKVNQQGEKVWDRTFGGTKDDELKASSYTDEGNYILAGTSYSDAGGDKSQASRGSTDYWIVQVDEKGKSLIDQRFGGSGAEELRTVFPTSDGGWLLGGRSDSGVSGDRSQSSQGGTDYWLVKVAPLSSALATSRQAVAEAEPISNATFNLLTASPNPAKERLTVSFTLLQSQTATLKVYDIQGKQVATLFQGQVQAKQPYRVEWQAGNKPAGMYLLQLQTPTLRQQQKLLVTK